MDISGVSTRYPIIRNYYYSAFGEIWQGEVSSDTNPFRYGGEYYDKTTGNIYLRARYYDPRIGRFISVDPIKDGTNWYVYCSNNPVMFVDPSGLSEMENFNTLIVISENTENKLARLSLTIIAYEQYRWLYGANRLPLVRNAVQKRISNSIDKIEKNKSIINAVAVEYGVRADILGGIVFKEQFTQSYPDEMVIMDTYITQTERSVGLCAIHPGIARTAWAYVNSNVYNSLPDSDVDLEIKLTDSDFNLQTMAAMIIYISENLCGIAREELPSLTEEQWKEIINHHNCANDYSGKVIEYLPAVRELLD